MYHIGTGCKGEMENNVFWGKFHQTANKQSLFSLLRISLEFAPPYWPFRNCAIEIANFNDCFNANSRVIGSRRFNLFTYKAAFLTYKLDAALITTRQRLVPPSLRYRSFFFLDNS